MNFNATLAEIAYRQEKVAHDYEIASGWSEALRRARRKVARLLAQEASAGARTRGVSHLVAYR